MGCVPIPNQSSASFLEVFSLPESYPLSMGCRHIVQVQKIQRLKKFKDYIKMCLIKITHIGKFPILDYIKKANHLLYNFYKSLQGK